MYIYIYIYLLIYLHIHTYLLVYNYMNECIHIDVFFDAINIIQSCNEHVHLAGCQVPMAELTELLPKRCRTLMNIFHLVGGLVAIFYFPIIILGIIIPIDGPYFSEGFKPPTSLFFGCSSHYYLSACHSPLALVCKTWV